MRHLRLLFLGLVGLLWLAGCGNQDAPGAAPLQAVTAVPPVPAYPWIEEVGEREAGTAPADAYVGDLDRLKQRGRLRILIPANIGGAYYLPRDGSPVEAQHEAAVGFARSQGLEPELVPIERFADMIPALLGGRGDVIAANLTVTAERRRRLAFSVPLTSVRQQLLVAAARDDIHALTDLDGRRVMVDPGSSFWERLQALRAEGSRVELVARPPAMSDEDELDAVAAGRVDASLRDSNVARMYLAYRDDLKVAFDLPGSDDIAWGVRPKSPRLLAALNKYLHLEFVADAQAQRHRDGLDGIRERKVLRVLLRNNAASYFLYKGELQGFEYELAKAFADANRLRLEVIVPDTHEQLIDWLLEGRADIAAGFLEPSAALTARGVAFSRPYHYAPRYVVVGADAAVAGPDDLAGRTITVRRSSPYWDELVGMQADGAGFMLEAAPETLETEELIERVASGEIEATVADGHLLDIELARGLPVRAALRISDDRAHAVALRAANDKLRVALDAFIAEHYKGLVYNILYKKYFTNQREIRDLAAGRPGGEGGLGLSPYDDIARRYADQYGFDWRLIVAQMFQESRFDPKARSFAGAEGLMQIIPRTARFMGFAELDGPEAAIHAGIKYLDWVRNRFEPELPVNERIWFSLAAYNAGHGHVADARRLARQLGLDGDRWFDNTERAMLMLSKKQHASKARYGYVRGSEAVAYVRDIRQRYRAYVEISAHRLSQREGRRATHTASPDLAAVAACCEP